MSGQYVVVIVTPSVTMVVVIHGPSVVEETGAEEIVEDSPSEDD